MNAEEFTAPFDLERFKNGDPAINMYGAPVTFHSISDECITTNEFSGPQASVNWASNFWRMKPKADDGWIKHDGRDICPIPWCPAGAWEYKARNGRVFSELPEPTAYKWGHWDIDRDGEEDIVAFRLTNNWIYVPGDGTIPEAIRGAKAGEWEYKLSNSVTVIVDVCAVNELSHWFKHEHDSRDIVAVRLVKTSAQEKVEKAVREASEKSAELARKLIENQKPRAAETDQQRRTREDYLAYKAKHPDPIPFTPMRENEQYEIAAAALAEHDKYWPRKKGN